MLVVWYKTPVRAPVNLVPVFFWYKFLACNRTQLYSITETVWHVTRTMQRDWLERVILAQGTVMNLHQIFRASFWSVYHRHKSVQTQSLRLAQNSTSLLYQSLTLTLIHPVSNWTHWTTLRRHPCLSRAATSASSQVNPIFRRSLLTTLLQFALGRPGPL